MSGQFFPGSCGDLNPAVMVVCTCRKEALPYALPRASYMLTSMYIWSAGYRVVVPESIMNKRGGEGSCSLIQSLRLRLRSPPRARRRPFGFAPSRWTTRRGESRRGRWVPPFRPKQGKVEMVRGSPFRPKSASSDHLCPQTHLAIPVPPPSDSPSSLRACSRGDRFSTTWRRRRPPRRG